MNWDQIVSLLDQYEQLGPLPGILVPMLESFLPILPLFAIVMGNAAAYGLWLGFFYSWIGVLMGSMIVFLISRKFGKKVTAYILRRYPKGHLFLRWIEKKGFAPIFLLSCFPLTPSFLVNIVSGLTIVPVKTFFIAVLFGKAIMVFFISFIGYDIFSIFEHPWKFTIIVSLILAAWLAGKHVEKRMREE